MRGNLGNGMLDDFYHHRISKRPVIDRALASKFLRTTCLGMTVQLSTTASKNVRRQQGLGRQLQPNGCNCLSTKLSGNIREYRTNLSFQNRSLPSV
jgi:hypothetical protein